MNTPNSIKTYSLTGYIVTYFDLREPKPRASHQTIVAYDRETIRAVGNMGENITDIIKNRFAKGGYFVAEIKKDRCIPVDIDLGAVYTAATDAAVFREAIDKAVCGESSVVSVPDPDGSDSDRRDRTSEAIYCTEDDLNEALATFEKKRAAMVRDYWDVLKKKMSENA